MPIVVVPPGASPGVLSNETMVSLEAICNVGSIAGTRDGSVSAWVQVRITPHGEVAPDAWGRFFHVVIEFVQPDMSIGKRRRQVPNWSTTDTPSPLRVEVDPAWYWIGTWARFYGTGGRAGDRYNVTMTTSTAQQESDARVMAGDPPFYQVDVMEPACLFQLTSFSMATVLDPNAAVPGPADHHTSIWLVHGSMNYGGVAITTPNERGLPLNVPVTTGTNTVYMTGGGV